MESSGQGVNRSTIWKSKEGKEEQKTREAKRQNERNIDDVKCN